MIIRKLRTEDLADLSLLYEQFWGEGSDLEKMQETFRRLDGNPDYIFLVAVEDGRLVGSVMGIVCNELYGECLPFMVVEDVIVEHRHRRLGIGSSLMQTLEAAASGRNCSYIIFVTEKNRIEAHHFYAALGYGLDSHAGFKKRIDRANR